MYFGKIGHFRYTVYRTPRVVEVQPYLGTTDACEYH